MNFGFLRSLMFGALFDLCDFRIQLWLANPQHTTGWRIRHQLRRSASGLPHHSRSRRFLQNFRLLHLMR